jgi:hypothetical protein
MQCERLVQPTSIPASLLENSSILGGFLMGRSNMCTDTTEICPVYAMAGAEMIEYPNAGASR